MHHNEYVGGCLGWPGGNELAMIVKLSPFAFFQIMHFSQLGLCSCVRGAERSHINAYKKILNVLCIYTDT